RPASSHQTTRPTHVAGAQASVYSPDGTRERREGRDGMAGLHKSEFTNPVVNWIDTRLPVFTMMQKEYGTFPTPKNFNYFWNFGALATVNLLIMIATGVFLAMNYTPNTDLAFDSVERI